MADQPIKYLPSLTNQNPSPTSGTGQEYLNCVQEWTDRIMSVFLKILPSNYASQVNGPFYSIQFQAGAEELAKYICTSLEVFYDHDYDFTRPEYLFQILGALVFPDQSEGVPQIDGDVSYRTFLKRMVELLLQGATPQTQQEGASLLVDSNTVVEIIERSIAGRDTPGSAWGFDDQFIFEVNMITDDGAGMPADPFTLQENIRLILQALKPAHTLYEYRHLFKETLGPIFSDQLSWDLTNYYYEDFRKYCLGIKEITGTGGITLTDRRLFSDPQRDYRFVPAGAFLVINSGLNAGTYQVEEVITYPVGDDPVARAYTTSPTGLTGFAKIIGGEIVDDLGNFGLVVENEILTFATGPNSGSYRLDVVLDVGKIEPTPSGFSRRVRPSPSIFRLRTRMPKVQTGQAYTVTVDRLGVQTTRTVTKEDVSIFFIR